MKLQELIQQTELDMTVPQVKAFYLGCVSGKKKMPFPKALEELLSATPEAKPVLETELKTLWDTVSQQVGNELKAMFPEVKDKKGFLTEAKDQLDYYLTALSLAGSYEENAEELEDLVEDIEDLLMEESAEDDEFEGLSEELKDQWSAYIKKLKL